MLQNYTTFAISVAETVLVQPWLWFTQLLSSSGMAGTFLAALTMFLTFKFLVAPFIGSHGASDTARQRKKEDE